MTSLDPTGAFISDNHGWNGLKECSRSEGPWLMNPSYHLTGSDFLCFSTGTSIVQNTVHVAQVKSGMRKSLNVDTSSIINCIGKQFYTCQFSGRYPTELYLLKQCFKALLKCA